MKHKNLLWKQVKAEIKLRHRILAAIMIPIFLFLAWDLTFGDTGLLKYLELREKRSRLVRKISDIERKNSTLKAELKLLKEDPFYKEKAAREQFGLARSGEIIFMFDEK